MVGGMIRRNVLVRGVLAGMVVCCCGGRRVGGYIDLAQTLGKVVGDAKEMSGGEAWGGVGGFVGGGGGGWGGILIWGRGGGRWWGMRRPLRGWRWWGLIGGRGWW